MAETALQLFDPIGSRRDDLPCFAVVLWLTSAGDSSVMLFGPDDTPPNSNGAMQKAEGKNRDHRFDRALHGAPIFQIRVVRRSTLIEVAAALKGVEPCGTLGNSEQLQCLKSLINGAPVRIKLRTLM
ncbi:hypothetical protein YH63_009590 [Afipia massiliensis]|uniref:Uncharacterized protein n=1 Tax=Afipia massiliensis TaxID=211460 RepID=A0A4U6BQ67_9BRAD|nr:hypothetical protein [Afipia massiliensis]TKT71645.1 hypothetical protein YH63_009590 [Afipia massiliensis]